MQKCHVMKDLKVSNTNTEIASRLHEIIGIKLDQEISGETVKQSWFEPNWKRMIREAEG